MECQQQLLGPLAFHTQHHAVGAQLPCRNSGFEATSKSASGFCCRMTNLMLTICNSLAADSLIRHVVLWLLTIVATDSCAVITDRSLAVFSKDIHIVLISRSIGPCKIILHAPIKCRVNPISDFVARHVVQQSFRLRDVGQRMAHFPRPELAINWLEVRQMGESCK